ncbi:carbon-nitrogen hydrolase family protein [Leifsonia sp. L25]|uniref:carbon-nitrogen hydrolase family protein n=1 Tax=Leifsonia sp. L25 TaxID=3423957 RepID=UPI003D69A004
MQAPTAPSTTSEPSPPTSNASPASTPTPTSSCTPSCTSPASATRRRRETAERIDALAEPLDGPRDRALAALAGDLGVWLVPGSFYERGEDGRVYNTTAAYSPEGRRAASYRKVFPWRPYETVAAGDEFVVFDMDGFRRIGLSICYDAWFPEHSRHLAWMGAELILNLVQTPTSDRAQEETIAKANAIVNQVFVASVNAAAPNGLGRSLLADPQGRVRVESASSESTVLSDVIDLDEVAAVRRYGSGGVTRPWRQYEGEVSNLELPLYEGRLASSRWTPTVASTAEVTA